MFVKTPRKKRWWNCLRSKQRNTHPRNRWKTFPVCSDRPRWHNKSFATSKYCLVSAFEVITLWKFLPEWLAHLTSTQFWCKFGQRSRFHSNLNKAATFIYARPRAVKCYKFLFKQKKIASSPPAFPLSLCWIIKQLSYSILWNIAWFQPTRPTASSAKAAVARTRFHALETA